MAHLDQPAEYVIEIEGLIDPRLVDWFGPIAVTGQAGRSTLAGVLADQAALVGLIRHLHALGAVLLAVKRVEPDRAYEGSNA